MSCAGAMSDAAEMLVELYKHLATAAARTEQPQLMACMFGLHVQVVSAIGPPAHISVACSHVTDG